MFCLFFWNEWRKRPAGRPGFGQLFGPKGTVYQVPPGTPEARNMLKKINIDPMPSVLSVE
jgi:hypothetical protein